MNKYRTGTAFEDDSFSASGDFAPPKHQPDRIEEILNDLWTARRLVGKAGAMPEQWAEVTYAAAALNSYILEELEDLLENGHGGGNWRRLIITKMAKFKGNK